MKADLHSLRMPTQNFGFRGPRNLRLGARCIVVDRESLKLCVMRVFWPERFSTWSYIDI